MKNLIIHIPHSSLRIPKLFFKKVLLSREEIVVENLHLCDLYTNKFIKNRNCYKVIFKYSRLFCDVEKFKDDSKEIMSKVGMGTIYTKDSNGRKLIDFDNEYREKILKKYYDRHHKRMDDLLCKVLKKNKMCYIIDLHSFSDSQAKKTLNLSGCPDICVGIDDDFYDENITRYVVDFFKKCGYKVKINYPYFGSFVPNVAYQNKLKNVRSIMIDINKRIYLNDNLSINKSKYNKLKHDLNKLVNDIINIINQNN